MQDEILINDELKKLLLSDEEIEKYFLTYLLHSLYQEKEEDNEIYLYDDYLAYNSLIYKDTTGINNEELKTSLLNVYKDLISDNMINKAYEDYKELALNEGKQLIYTLSRLLYIQNKYKDDEIGKKIDKKIKEWLSYIKGNDEELKQDTLFNTDDGIDKNVKIATNSMFKSYNQANAKLLYANIPRINYDIYNNVNNPMRKFMDLWNYDIIKMSDLKEFLLTGINNNVTDSQINNRLNEIINGFLNDIESDINMTAFQIANEDKIKELSDKHLKDKKVKKGAKLEELSEITDPFLDELSVIYNEWKKDNEIYLLDSEDIKNWRNKAEEYINHLLGYKKDAKLDLFNMDYTLKHLAYNDYQKKEYKLNLDDIKEEKGQDKDKITDQKTRLSKDELKEKYKDITQLNGKELDYNRNWARLDTNKVNTNILDLREKIIEKTKNNTLITTNKLKQLEKIAKPSKEDLAKKKELEELLKQQKEEQLKIKEEIKDNQADLDLLDKQMLNTTDPKELKRLKSIRKSLDNKIKELEAILRNEGVFLQGNLFNDKLLVAEKVNPKTKETYRLMINSDYDIQNFNSEGRNFIYYIPNIPNIRDELEEDFITIDINDYLDFTGRPNGNVSRIRTNLQNTLKEMRKETYDYTYVDEKGAFHEDSLVLIADIKSTEYKGKASVKVQLGGTFKENLKQTFIKSQYVKVNSDIFKIGQGRNNKAENMAKEIFLYLAKLCRVEAKKQVNSGKWCKAMHLDTIIQKLCELKLISYNPNRYSESVKEPLLYALNTGVELGYFEYQTDAFKYYDDVVSSNNRGANIKDKITNFEKGNKYGIEFTINGDMVDLESNTKANKNYNKYKNSKKKTTKK